MPPQPPWSVILSGGSAFFALPESKDPFVAADSLSPRAVIRTPVVPA